MNKQYYVNKKKCPSQSQLIKYLNVLEQATECWSIGKDNKKKIYIDGEFDSNQTEYEKQSNYAEIGVKVDLKSKQKSFLPVFRVRNANVHHR